MIQSGFFRCLGLAALSTLVAVSTVSAQKTKTITKPKSGETTVYIMDDDGKQIREIERVIRTDGMSDPERDRMITKLVDSVKATQRQSAAGQRQMTVIVEDGNARSSSRQAWSDTTRRGTFGNRRTVPTPPTPPNDDWTVDMHRQMDTLASQMKRLRYRLPAQWNREVGPVLDGIGRNSKPSTIRGLTAYPNNPDREQLNIRFMAPDKGNVLISVTNTQGKEVARRDIKDFSGEFVGQIGLAKNAVGTYFVTVTQNNDGAVTRVVIE